jgi:hypothetical protein
MPAEAEGRIRASCESRRWTVAGRKMSRRATVSWRKRNVFRKTGTQENRGPRKEFPAVGIRMIHCAGVEWLRRGFVTKDCTRAKVDLATQTVGPFGKNLRMHHEGKCGTKDLGGKRPPFVRKKRATVVDIGGWSSKQLSPLGRRVSVCNTLKKTL